MYTIVTTIAEPTKCICELVVRLKSVNGTLVAVGDKKGPFKYKTENTIFLPLAEQMDMPYELAKLLPMNHYARKNLGYLYAFTKGAELIYETDDDNAPNQYWKVRNRQVQTRVCKENGWVNVYDYFTDDFIWPRGLPLDKIRRSSPLPLLEGLESQVVDAPIQQGLADISPDVDALWRLLMDKPFDFNRGESIVLQPGSWCPFNSQSTWWWPEAFPLMYLPSFCSFRMTDIWRSFIAQRCIWAMNKGIVFHAAEVSQVRNVHNLMGDFEAEVCGYLGNDRFAQILDALDLLSGTENAPANLLRCYKALVAADYFPVVELDLVRAWILDLQIATACDNSLSSSRPILE